MAKQVAVVGGGMMGAGIAACLASGGPHTVRICSRTIEEAEACKEKALGLVHLLVESGAAAEEVGQIEAVASLPEAVAGAEFIFEVVFEDLAVKQGVMQELEQHAGPNAIFCTNTSSLSVTAIAEGCKKNGAERIIAAHFIGPAHLVPLVELCPGALTAGQGSDDGPIERVRKFLESIGKRPIVMKKEIQGFIAARLQAALYRECLHIVQSGSADCEAVDRAVFDGFGRRLNQIGPFQQADFAGVDLVQGTHARFFPQLGDYQRDVRADELVSQGRLGTKTLAGHYDWTDERVKEVMGRRDAELLRRLKADRLPSSRSSPY